jgi:hypothetical protein
MKEDVISPSIEPAFTPSFLAHIAHLERQPHTPERQGVSWVAFLLNAVTRRAPQLSPQPLLLQVTPSR